MLCRGQSQLAANCGVAYNPRTGQITAAAVLQVGLLLRQGSWPGAVTRALDAQLHACLVMEASSSPLPTPCCKIEYR